MHIKKTNLFLLILCFSLISIAIAACTTPETPETAVPAETEKAIEQPTSSPTIVIETEEPNPDLEETGEPEEPEEPEVDESEDVDTTEMSACVECHTDQTMLIDTAAPQEEVESENEGAG